MTRRRANDERPRWVWKDVDLGSMPDPITPLVFNLLVTLKWWSDKDRRKRERSRKWLESARRKFRIRQQQRPDQ